MKIKKLLVACTVGITACLFGLLGCTGNSDPSTQVEEEGLLGEDCGSLVIAVQRTQNVPNYSQFYEEYVKEAQERKASVEIVIVDGDPQFAFAQPIELGSQKSNSSNRANEEAAQLRNIEAVIEGCAGETDEVDVIKALVLADKAHASSSSGKGVTVIASSGLSTTGMLSLNAKMLGVESDSVLAYLKGYGYELPHTQTVVWFALGDTEAPQEELTPALKKWLEALYEDLLLGLGVGNVVFVEGMVPSKEYDNSLPRVSAVDIPDVPELSVSATDESRFDSSQLPFKPGTAELIDADDAAEKLAPLVQAMMADDGLRAEIIGSTASYPWKEGYAYQLGLDRAQTVKDLLVMKGVPEARIEIGSYGDEGPGHVDDIDEVTGLQIPDRAQQNRYVIVRLIR